MFQSLDLEVLLELLNMICTLLHLDFKLAGQLLLLFLHGFDLLLRVLLLLLELEHQLADLYLEVLDLFRFLKHLAIENRFFLQLVHQLAVDVCFGL